MEPTKQGGDGPFDLNSSNDPARLRDGSSSPQPPPSSLVEQTMPPPPPPLNPPQLLQQQPYPRPSVPNFTEHSYFALPAFFPRATLPSHTIVNPEPPFANQLAPSSHQSTPNSSANGHHPGAVADYSLWASNSNASLAPYASHLASMSRSGDNVPQPDAASAFSMGVPNASLDPYAPPWTPMTSSSGNVPQPGVSADFSLLGFNASFNPYAFASLPAHLTESHRLWSFSQEIHDLPHGAFRANLLNAPAHPALLTYRQISARVASMLDQGDQDMRVWVMQAVSRDVHRVMGSELASAVFLALLRAVARAPLPPHHPWIRAVGEEQSQELRIIVEAAASRRDRSLMSVANSAAGYVLGPFASLLLPKLVRNSKFQWKPPLPFNFSRNNALRELFGAVAKNDGLCRRLFNCLVDEWIMGQRNGPELLQYLFTQLKYVYCSIFINRLALPRFADMVTSKFGWRCMLLCLQNAMSDVKQTEFLALKEAILRDTVGMAKSRYGNRFLQEILKGGYGILIKNPIRERVEQDLQELSTHPLGSNVVEACYVPDPEEPDLFLVQRGLDAFLGLTETQLVQLVPDSSASRVLCNLLGIGKDIEVRIHPFPITLMPALGARSLADYCLICAGRCVQPLSAWARSMKLARRIEKVLGAADQGNPFVRQVMEVVREVLSRQQRR
ncbi:hypothetical protein HU200_025562 [Digitaria exilis]|uniref:Uncharacterized protein n=1 Tax=Digitaria exilis TaxID=1010633 RepID=A0A835EV53_9POAL|nr:hypothetical protein HU200_025562 [Digitaria exilis]